MLFWINVKFRGLKLQNYFSHDVYATFFPQVIVICLHLIKNVSLGLNIYQRHF